MDDFLMDVLMLFQLYGNKGNRMTYFEKGTHIGFIKLVDSIYSYNFKLTYSIPNIERSRLQGILIFEYKKLYFLPIFL